jgi:hypothetical protein
MKTTKSTTTSQLETLSDRASSAIARGQAETAFAVLDEMRAILIAHPRTPRAVDWAEIIMDRTAEAAGI